ncbi:hypothetical protein GCM10025858_14780 [Alicyclobacillus sacchari]|nr:hypothetical protein GCM10025858_14780 [Alicyclobacillus sacchari]
MLTGVKIYWECQKIKVNPKTIIDAIKYGKNKLSLLSGPLVFGSGNKGMTWEVSTRHFGLKDVVCFMPLTPFD